jgi:hypothetical protein
MSIYRELCGRGQLRFRSGGTYYEKHHIIPKCLDGTNANINITLLTAREHYIAHRLLCIIHRDSIISIRAKLSSAFNRMCSTNKHKRFFNSRQFDIARREFLKNHPMRDPAIRLKVQESHQIRGELIKQQNQLKLPYCKCGCGVQVKNKHSTYTLKCFDRKLNKRGFTSDIRKNMSVKAVNRINNLTPEQKKQRLLKTLHSERVDHILRGKKISLGKKGKSTNQYEIMGRRFANMTDNEFKIYLDSKSLRVYNRFTILRDKWKNIQQLEN